MGFFGSIWNGIKKIGKFVHNVGSSVRRGIGKAYNFVSNIPVIGGAVKAATNIPIPMLGGRSVSDVAKLASTGVDLAGEIGNGNIGGAMRQGGRLFSQIRGGR